MGLHSARDARGRRPTHSASVFAHEVDVANEREVDAGDVRPGWPPGRHPADEAGADQREAAASYT